MLWLQIPGVHLRVWRAYAARFQLPHEEIDAALAAFAEAKKEFDL